MEQLLEWVDIIEDIELKNGIPSHDAIQCVMGMIRPENLQQLQRKWQELIRKWCLSMLKLIEIRRTKMSLKRKRFNISFAPAKFIEELMKI